MSLELGPIIEEIANRADDFLTDVRNRKEARAGITELLAADYPALSPAQKSDVVNGVIRVLEEEDFFGIEFVGDPFSAGDAAEEE